MRVFLKRTFKEEPLNPAKNKSIKKLLSTTHSTHVAFGFVLIQKRAKITNSAYGKNDDIYTEPRMIYLFMFHTASISFCYIGHNSVSFGTPRLFCAPFYHHIEKIISEFAVWGELSL